MIGWALCLSAVLGLGACDDPELPPAPGTWQAQVPEQTPPGSFSESLGDETQQGDAAPELYGQRANCPTQRVAPYDASQLSVGLYWYAPSTPDAPGGVGCRAAEDGRALPGYYDPAKPILIFVHGWQYGSVAKGQILGTSLSTRRDNFWFEAGGLNVADGWLRAGWNVGLFHWTQLADDQPDYVMPFNAQAKIWTHQYVRTLQGQPQYIGMRWRTPQGYTLDQAPALSVGELFYRSYKSALSQWSYRGEEPVRLLGHSLGAQLVLALGDQAYRDPGLPVAQRPRRLILADPYWTPARPVPGHSYAYLAPDPSPAARSARLSQELIRQGAVIEWVKSSALLDLGGDNNSGLLDLVSRSELLPTYLLGDLNGQHGVAPRWYLWSLSLPGRENPVGATNPLADAAAVMERRERYVQGQGRLTALPGDDTFFRAYGVQSAASAP